MLFKTYRHIHLPFILHPMQLSDDDSLLKLLINIMLQKVQIITKHIELIKSSVIYMLFCVTFSIIISLIQKEFISVLIHQKSLY